ncbi:hypothetical protein PFISCL1PPCAC_19646 [Pristionchus fissidentatus]|uniref:Peptidase n=1 Tax=Pristionchus fissidentatus TaxID=1538716 RepID=A0AAV5WC92_9BILA|nr:hypothetical protein PFISCL1PPCAC_19646 [Pristionchus fissidentatus]
MPNKVVVTGFGPFGSHQTNPSAEVAKALTKYPLDDCEVVAHEMRVVYSEVKDTVPKLWVDHDPDLVIHIGVHSEHQCVKIEKQAFADGYCRFDVDGCVPHDNKCVGNLDQTLKSSIDVEGVVEMTKKELKGEMEELCIQSSDDPGRYLCGFSYYLSLSNDNTKALFIHIPPVNEKITVELLTRVVATIILTVFKHF